MKYKLLMIIGVLLLLTACPRPTAVRREVVDFRTGIQSLEIDFAEQGPPDQVFEGEDVPILLFVANRGASDIFDGVFTIDVDPTVLELRAERLNFFDLPGKSQFNPIGEERIISINTNARTLPPRTETVTTTIRVTACYPYRTAATETLCIDTDILGRATNKPCQVQDASLGSQGAPVTVNRIEPRMLQHMDETKINVEFLIHMSNRGAGQLFPADKAVEACTAGAVGELNKAKVNVFLADQQLDCVPKAKDSAGPEAEVNLAMETFVKCSVPDGISKRLGTYLSPLTIEVDYGYSFTVSKNVEIRTLQ